MQKLTVDQVKEIHSAVFGYYASDRDIVRDLKEAEETLALCREEVTLESVEELFALWFNEEHLESVADHSERSRLMLDDA